MAKNRKILDLSVARARPGTIAKAVRGIFALSLGLVIVPSAVAPKRAEAVSVPTFTPLTPARILDTRPGSSTIDGVAAGAGPVGNRATVELVVLGRGGVPSTGVTAVVVNITAVQPTAGGFTTVYPTGDPQPNASSLNWTPGIVIPNLVTVKVGAEGKISIFNSDGNTNYLADVTGWYSNDGFTALSPARLLDTRAGGRTIDSIGAAGGRVGAAASIEVSIAGRGGLPAAGASAAILNVTAVNPSMGGYTTVYPSGEAQPNASNLNWVAGQVIPNAVTVKLGTNGKITIFNSDGLTDYLVDVVGYFDAASTYTPLTPARLVDTRPDALTIDHLFEGFGARFPSESSAFQVTGRGGVPSTGVSAVVLNVTAIAFGNGYSTIYPTGEALPNASSLNFTKDQTIPNMVIAKVGSGGKVSGYTSGAFADAIVDVVGYFSGVTPPDTTTLPQAGVVAIGAGASMACAVVADSSVRCWGNNDKGQLGNGTTIGSSIPVLVSGLTGVLQLSGGARHMCALTIGAVFCWGNNDLGQLGNGLSGANAFSATPQRVSGISTASQISAGYTHTCALLADQTVRCWGGNSTGQLGIGSQDPFSHSTPQAFRGAIGVRKIATRFYESCALPISGNVKCAGFLVLAPRNLIYVLPTELPGIGTGLDIAVSDSQAICILNIDRSVGCFGANGSGELGRGTVDTRATVDSGFPLAAVTGLSG
jgi:Regulator of chromosome condensation (RCC1) repeat